MSDPGFESPRSDGINEVLERLEAAPEDTSLIESLVTQLAAAEPHGRVAAVDRAKAILRGHWDALTALGQALLVRSFPDCELLGARVLLEILRGRPDSSEAVRGIASALSYVNELDDAQPIAEEALRLTQRDVRLLDAWMTWLGKHGHEDHSRPLADETATSAVRELQAAPDNFEMITTLASALEYASPDTRTDTVNHATQLLSERPDALVRLGDALWRRSFGGCELMGAQVLAAALRADAHAAGALDGIASALSYVNELDDAQPIAEEALRLTQRDVRLLDAWMTWLGKHGHEDHSRPLADETATSAVRELQAAPDNFEMITTLASALEYASPDTRTDTVNHATQLLSERPDALVRLGDALWRRSFGGCELMGAQVLAAALRADAHAAGALDGIASALSYVNELDDAQPIAEEALRLTQRDVRLLDAWMTWLGKHGHEDHSRPLADETATSAVRELQAAPDNFEMITTLASALEYASPDTRTDTVNHATQLLSERPDALVRLGDALWRRSFGGCELMGAQVLAAALRADAHAAGALDGIASALSYVNELDDAQPIAEEALRLTQRDVRLLDAWMTWLGKHGHEDHSRPLADETATSAVRELQAAPDNFEMITTLASALEYASPDTRTDTVNHATQLLSERPDALVRLGDALWRRSFGGCELMGAQVLAAALRADAHAAGALDGIASALSYVNELDDAQPIAEEALRLTQRDVRLLDAWMTWLGKHGHEDHSRPLADETATSAVRELQAAPDNFEMITTLASALEYASPDTRTDTVNHATQLLSERPDALVRLGDALWRRSFGGCELMGAQVLAAALRADAHAAGALDGIASALSYVNELDDAQPIAEEALRLTQRDVRLLDAWMTWLGKHGHEDHSRPLADETATSAVRELQAAPDNFEMITTLASALEYASPDTRTDTVNHATQLLSERPDALVRLGDALWRRSFGGCELMGAQVLAAALRADAHAAGALDGIASALVSIPDTEDARSMAEEGLQLIADDSDLLSEWHASLDRVGSATADAVLPRGSAYGRCRCAGTVEQRTVSVRMSVGGDTIVLDDVPQGSCPSCGARVYKRNVLAVVEAVMRGGHASDTAPVPEDR